MLALIALGSNLGDRRGNLAGGLAALAELGRVAASPLVMETPDESGSGPDYLNTVALLETHLDDPAELLEALLRIELRWGRDRAAGRNAPRALDLDYIAADHHRGRWRWPSPPGLQALGPELDLVLPHPRAALRPFVLEPLDALRRANPKAGAPWLDAATWPGAAAPGLGGGGRSAIRARRAFPAPAGTGRARRGGRARPAR